MTITKVDDVVGTTAPGATIIYTLTYDNVGDQDATGVVVTETVPANTTFTTTGSSAGWSCTPGATAGSTCTLTLGAVPASDPAGTLTFAVVLDNPLAAGVTEINNAVSIADDGTNGDDPTPENNSDDEDTPVGAAPDMTITKVDDVVGSTLPGATIIYTLTYDNVGDQNATGVVVTETVPANTTFTTTGSSAGWSCVDGAAAGTTCTLSLGNVPASDPAGTLTFAVVLDNPLAAGVTEINNAVSIADDGTNGDDPTPENNSDDEVTPVDATPDMTITKVDDVAGSTLPGATIIYTLTYDNVGDQDATGVVVTETVPDNTTFTTTGSSAGWTCTPDATAGSICTLTLGAVPASDPAGTLTFAVIIDNPLAAGVTEINNAVSIADDGTNGDDPTPDNNSDDEVTPVDATPDMTITKVDDVADTTAPGATIIYTLTYDNVGDQDATGVVVTETVPANTTFTTTGSSAGWSCVDGAAAGTTCTLTLGAVPASDPAGTLTFAVVVDNPLAAGVTEINNAVSIADDGTNGDDPTPDNNSDDEDTPVELPRT